MKVSIVFNIAIRWLLISRFCLKRWREVILRGTTRSRYSSGLQRLKGPLIKSTIDSKAILFIKLLKRIGNPNKIKKWLKASKLCKRNFLNALIRDFSFQFNPSWSPFKSNHTFVPHRLSAKRLIAQCPKKLSSLGALSTPTMVGFIQFKWTPPSTCRCLLKLIQMSS